MWGAKLCCVLLLGSYTLAQQDVGSLDDPSPLCFLAKRYKNFKRFVYNYEAETLNGVNGATDNKSGPKVHCTVEIDVPQTCSFILRTTDCSLSEISGVDDEGKPVYRPAAGAEDFKAAMAKNPLKMSVEGQNDVKLYPEDDESTNILNVKRGVVSALLVPDLDEEKSAEMPTVHGVCSSELSINSRDDDAVDVTVSRDLTACDWFVARRRDTSPLALVSGMNYPLSKMISSSQICNYKFDSREKHMTSGSCTEKHIFLPFSHRNEFGISAVVRQTVTLTETSRINDRVFHHNENLKQLPMEAVDDKLPVQNKEAVLTAMQKLSALSQTTEGEERAGLFRKLVSELRGLKGDVLISVADEMMDVSGSLAWQALAQCGTPECTSGMLKILRGFHHAATEVDAVVYALGMLSNPSRLMVKDLLAMAQYKQSKPIMYALSNAATRLYKSEGVTPEITAVFEYITSLLGEDCAGEKDLTFLTLRVVGNMGEAMEAADPAIKNTLLKCMRQPSTTLSVQLAAIQAFRRMSVTEEVRVNLQKVTQYAKGAVQKRLAAYLILMRDPQESDFQMVKKLLSQEENMQVKAFVSSHVYNIISSTDSETKKLGKRIMDVLQDTEVVAHNEYTTMSRNYKLGVTHDSMQASIQGNVIFDSSNQLPKEVLLETTLEAFGYSMDIWEMGMEGKGFEPTIEALFGQNGFFPDSVSKALYWAEDKMPPKIREVLEKWLAPLKSGQPKVPENLMEEMLLNFNKLLKDLQSQESPEAMAYLRIMGTELGFIKGSDLKFIVENAILNAKFFMHHAKFMGVSMPGLNNEIFAHYIFMDNKFTLPTASGLPMTFALSGTFAPGAKGGLHISPNMKELLFSPSVGVEFMTQMGVQMPEFVVSAVEMRTNLFHESSLSAKITMEQNQVKLSIPAPQGTTKLFRISNKVEIVGSGQATMIPHKQSKSKCNQLFSGIKFCSTLLYADAHDKTTAPYFPLNGETTFAFDIEPTKEITEYTATVVYDLLSEGKDGRHKVDSLKMILRAEGKQPTEATATMKYNRNRNIFTTQIQIPDIDVEAGVKMGVTDSSSKGKSIFLELSNKNVQQLSLIGRAKLQAMNDGMLQVQLLVPSLRTDASLTATMSNTEGLTMQLKSDVKLPEVSSVQAVTVKYGKKQVEVSLMSNMNADTKIPVRYTKAAQALFGQLANDVMDRQVDNTDMKLRHILNKGLEATNIWMDKISADVPCIKKLRNSVEMMQIPSVPENVFMNLESNLRYQFNQNSFMMTIPLPLGGKTSEELRIPSVVTSPRIFVPQLELDFAPQEIPMPRFTIPSEYDLTLPLLGLMEASAKVNSNYYDWEAVLTAGNNTAESPEYVAKFSIMAESPIRLLSFSAEGASKITDTDKKTIEVTVDGALKHMLVNTGFSVMESVAVTDNVLTMGQYKLYAAADPVGLNTNLTVTTQYTLDSNMFFGDVATDGSIAFGPLAATTTYHHTFSVEPAKKEAKMDSILNVNSKKLKVFNKIKASYERDELLFKSTTDVNHDPITHTTKINLSYKEFVLGFQSDSVTNAYEKMIHSKTEFSSSLGQAALRVETQAEDKNTQNRAYYLLTGAMNPSGLEINADASINIFSSIASHKATLSLTTNGLTTSCTTTARHSPFTFENIFHGGVDTSGATLSLTTKGTIQANKAELTMEGKLATTEVYLNSMFAGNLFDVSSRNRVNLRLNEDGLVFSNNMVGSFREMKTDNTHSLSLNLRSFTLQSKTDNFLDSSNSYMQDITLDMKRFTVSAAVKNDLKVMAVNFVNDAKFKAEPYNVELAGTLMGSFSEEELKHTYEIKVADMILSAKCNTNGKLLGSHMTHDTDVEVDGLTVKFNNVANFNSPFLRLDSTIKSAAAPFALNVDAIFNSNGEVHVYGQHNGAVYSKFLLKAEPTLFTQSFEYRASTSHEMADRPAIKTSIDNKMNNMLTLQEQSVSLKVTSTVNEHVFNQELSAYNNPTNMGIEMKGAVSTPLFSEDSQDYAISGFVKYDKNSDSHSILIPFIEHLPAVIDNMKTTVMELMDYSIEMLKDVSTRYEISAKFQDKMAELKDAIDNFEFNLFVQDLKEFITFLEKYITELMAKFPTDKIINQLKSIKDAVKAAINKYNIHDKLAAVYIKIEEFLSNYEVEKIIGAFMDEVVEIMRAYQIREKLQLMFEALTSIDIQPLLNKALVPVKELMNELYAFDFKQLIDDMSDYFMRMIQKIQSYDYETLTKELKQKVEDMSKIPCFGKLYGEFKVTSPHYKLRTTADLENTTTSSITPEFKINLNSWADSTLNVLDFTVDASAQFSAPEMSRLTFSEIIKVHQSSFTLEHKGAMDLYGLSALASAETTAKITTEPYVAELLNNVILNTENEISATMKTTYKHDLKMPPINMFSEMMTEQNTVFRLAEGTMHLTLNNQANGKHAVQRFSDEATHKSDIDVEMDLHKAKVTFTGVTSSNHLKMNQNLDADICIFRHVIINAKAETETPFMKGSVAEVKLQAKVEGMKIDLTASHNAELVGQVEGGLASSAVALIKPTELLFDVKNKGKARAVLPFRLSGEVDLQNDVAFTLTSEVHQASWTGLARFNQYKYSHSFSMDNGEREINIISQINGEADLDLLKKPITIPEITLPFVDMKTPRVEDYSLWEDTGLSYILITTQQTLDMKSNLKYVKNPETITIDINLEPVINTINTNMEALHKRALTCKDKATVILASSYDKAKAEYEKYSIELPKTIEIPAYRVPVMNVETSSFTIPLPDASLMTMPALHVPSALNKLTVPKISLPKIQTIKIPLMGDLTYKFSMKTAPITLKTDASVLNQDGLSIKLDASSLSEFDILNGKIEASTKVNTVEEFQLASSLSVKHSVLEGKHKSAIVLSFENVDTSIINSAKINLPSVTMEINQEMKGNPAEGLVVSMSTPSSGLIAVQMQTKRPAQVKARLYGRYPTKPTTDVDIVGLKVSVVESRKLNLQTTWNTEMPYEMMLGLKKHVPEVVEMVSDPALRTYKKLNRHARGLKSSLERATKQGKEMLKNAVENLAAVSPSDLMPAVIDKTILILREYQKKVELVLDAVVRFLKQTKFQIPGYERRLSGLEIYQNLSAFVADVSEEAVEKIPKYFTSMFAPVFEQFQTIQFSFPGSDRILSGKEILDNILEYVKKIQEYVIGTVRKLGDTQLEDKIRKIQIFTQFIIEQSENFLQKLKHENIDSIYNLLAEWYSDLEDLPVLADASEKLKAFHRIILEYLSYVMDKLSHITLPQESAEQLRADIQSWIDSMVKGINTFHNNVIRSLKEKSKSVESYVKVGDRQIEVDIPLPNVARFN